MITKEVKRNIILTCSIFFIGLSVLIVKTYFIPSNFEIIEKEKLVDRSDKLSTKKIFSQPKVRIHIAGAVYQPGVYEFDSKISVLEAIELAGGFLESARLDGINLAKPIKDGQRIRVPYLRKPRSKKNIKHLSSTIYTNIISINTGTANQLRQIKGIGPTTAKRIINYRQQNGVFQSLNELKKVKGVGDATYLKIRDRIKL